jgi:hypothetical protein
MVVATRTDTSLAATITQTTLVNAIKTAFTNAGYSTLVEGYASGTDQILVYQFVTDATKIYGTVYLRIRITTALAIFQQLFSTWVAGTHANTNGSTEVFGTTVSSSIAINFVSLNGGLEYGLVLLTQGTTFIPLGVIAPITRPSYWDLNSWNWGFIFNDNTLFTWLSCNLNSFSNQSYDTFLNNARLGTANSITLRRDILGGITLLSQSNRGIAGQTSNDIGMGCFSGNSRYDSASSYGSSAVYLVITNVAGGLAIRTS